LWVSNRSFFYFIPWTFFEILLFVLYCFVSTLGFFLFSFMVSTRSQCYSPPQQRIGGMDASSLDSCSDHVCCTVSIGSDAENSHAADAFSTSLSGLNSSLSDSVTLVSESVITAPVSITLSSPAQPFIDSTQVSHPPISQGVKCPSCPFSNTREFVTAVSLAQHVRTVHLSNWPPVLPSSFPVYFGALCLWIGLGCWFITSSPPAQL